MIGKSRALIIAQTLILALVLAGCQPAPPPAPTATNAPPTAVIVTAVPTPPPLPPVAVMPTAAPRHGHAAARYPTGGAFPTGRRSSERSKGWKGLAPTPSSTNPTSACCCATRNTSRPWG